MSGKIRERSGVFGGFVMALALLAAYPVAGTPLAPSNTVVRFQIQRGTNSLGAMDVELFDRDKPESVRNFLLYVRSGAYSNNFLHRCVPGFIVQGGGFSMANPIVTNRFSTYLEVTNYGRLTNEFLVGPRLSNTFGTLAMAKISGDTNSATSQWFFNLANNSTNLDNQNGGFTVFGRVLEGANGSDGTNVLRHFNTLSTSTGIVNLGTLISSSYSVFNTLPVAYTNTAQVPASRDLYYVQISELNRTNSPGLLPPSVAIESPGPDSRFTNETVTIRGTASDDIEVARVVYRFTNGPLEIATGTTNWQFAVSPRHGFNTVTVESIDWDGKRSTNAASVTFLHIVQVPLTLETTGSGTVAGAFNGQLVQLGRFYTVTAKPASGFTFGGWTGSVTASTASVTFQVPTNATNFILKAKFNGNPFPSRVGNYQGVFQSTGTPTLANAGFMSLTLNSTGFFSGRILHRGGTYTFTGLFNRSGSALIQGTVGGVNRLITLQLDTSNPAGLITGSFSGGTNRLERLAANLGSGNAPGPGRYTFVLPDISANASGQLKPGGFGFGIATLNKSGVLSASVRLGDGTAFAVSPPMTRLKHWPIYVNLFGGRGAVVGWLTWSTNQPANLDGNLQWIKGANARDATYPAGFASQLAVVGSRYASPEGARTVNWAHGLARMDGADLLVGITNIVRLRPDNSLTAAEPNPVELAFSVDTQNGLVRGSFAHPWAGTVNQLRGVVLQRSGGILGQFIDGKQTGTLNVQAAPFLVTQSVVNVTLPGLLEALSDGGLLRFETNGVIRVTEPLPVNFDTALDANGYSITLDGGAETRLFEVPTNVNFSARGITFANGRDVGANGADFAESPHGGDACGAGILNLGGEVGFTNCVFTNFVVIGGDAVLGSETEASAGSGGRALGAVICNRGGKVTLQNCQLLDNRAEAGRSGSNVVTHPISNSRGMALGGALYSEAGECEIVDSVFSRNLARGGEAQSSIVLPENRSGDGAGGAIAISAGRLRIASSLLSNNIAQGGGAVTSTVAGGGAHGGAVFAETNAEVIIERTTLSRNQALGGSGQDAETAHAIGGAVASGSQLTLNGCTFDENLAQGGMVPSTNALAGGPATGGAVFVESGSLLATNCTFAFNRALGGSNGETNATVFGQSRGGAVTVALNAAALVNVTLAFNEAGPILQTNTSGAGSAIASVDATLTLRNSLLASNTTPGVFGNFIDGDYNLSSETATIFTAANSRTGLDPLLSPLTDNGGPTRTMALLPLSPARDRISANNPPVDQRGTTRPQGPLGDIGAFEFIQNLPVFTNGPVSTNVRLGTNFTLVSSAGGPPPIGYFWLKDGTPLARGTNATLNFTNVQLSDAGDYAAVATNSFGATTSAVATVTVDARPSIQNHPLSVTVAPSSSTSFTVGALPTNGLSYSWLRNGLPLASATNATLSIAAAGAGDQGNYQVIVTNFAGAATSQVATLTFSSIALAIVQQPSSTTNLTGQPATLGVLVSGIGPFTFQWLFGTNTVGDAVTTSSSTNALPLAAVYPTNAGSYRVVVTNAYNAITSTSATLTVITQPTLSIEANATNVLITCHGDPFRLHRLLSATNPADTAAWTAIATNGLSGTGTFTWTRPLPTNGVAFYRVVVP